MKGPYRSRRTKGGGFRNKAVQLKQSLNTGFIVVTLGLLVVLNGLFIYSLITKFLSTEKRVPGEETPFGEGVFVRDRTIRVEVLNGAGRGGLAQSMTDFLRREGSDVIDFGNAETFNYHETVVLVRSEDRAAAKLVASAINTTNVVDQKNPFLTLDVTLIIGRDYRKLLPFQSERRWQ
jgi:hypothetical protein